MKPLVIGIDFDGTVVKHKYPEIGDPLEGAIEVLEELMEAGHKLILTTMRSDERLAEAVEYLEANGIELWAVNKNRTQHHWTTSPKVFCHLIIDDTALGCPLVIHDRNRPYVDWAEVRELLVEREILE